MDHVEVAGKAVVNAFGDTHADDLLAGLVARGVTRVHLYHVGLVAPPRLDRAVAAIRSVEQHRRSTLP
ncbi:MAG: hypothetical protein BGO26_20685 [Actinobacteria bacterium 69-20]|nr:MAG: hypothetical protein BGO26_20685 [Actinobacteria bacterium 69-20]